MEIRLRYPCKQMKIAQMFSLPVYETCCTIKAGLDINCNSYRCFVCHGVFDYFPEMAVVRHLVRETNPAKE